MEIKFCDCCRQPTGAVCYTHPFTNSRGSDGTEWGEAGRCLCWKCSHETATMTDVHDYYAYKLWLASEGKPADQEIEAL